MKRLYLLFILSFTCGSILMFAVDSPRSQLEIAVDLCVERKEAGFIAGKAAIDSHKFDEEADTILFLKEIMCGCRVSHEYDEDLFKIADDVTKKSSSPLCIGIAWYQKSQISFHRGDYKNALTYSDIALSALKKEEYRAAEGNVSFRELYECFCHIVKKDSYEGLHDKEGYEAEKKILKTYKWATKLEN